LQQEQQRINKSMRLAQEIRMMRTPDQPETHMTQVNKAIHTIARIAIMVKLKVLIPVTERNKISSFFLFSFV
jgi:hypothetical protein